MTGLAGSSIELWVEPRGGRPAVNGVMELLMATLVSEGATCVVRVLESEIIDPMRLLRQPRPDLVLLKAATTLALSTAVADEAAGIRFLNGARATLRAHDKAAIVARLAACGLPVPESYLFTPAGTGELANPDPTGRWVTKPVRGVHGRGVRLHPVDDVMLQVSAPAHGSASHVLDDGTQLLQRRIGGDEADIKVYVVGDECFAGAKSFTAHSYATDEIEEQVLDARTTEIVLAVGACLDLRLFGVDLRFDAGNPVVIDANPFPGYRGFPAAAEALRGEIVSALGDGA